MFKFLLPVLLAIGCAPQIKEVRVEVVKPCLTQAPPDKKLGKFEPYDGPRKIEGVDENGDKIVGVASIVSVESFIRFGAYIRDAQAWMDDAYARCNAAK